MGPTFRWILCLNFAVLLAITSPVGALFRNFPGVIKPAVSIGVPGLDEDLQIAKAFIVSLRRRSDLGYFCAGALISTRHVLTAAHCVDSSRTSTDNQPQVVVGSDTLTVQPGGGVQVLSTKSVVFHPDYFSRAIPDLAILELDAAANVTPVGLPTSTNFRPQNGQSLEMWGWGRKTSSSGIAEVIQTATVPYIPPLSCSQRSQRYIFPYHICMGGEGPSSCPGDDGGPVLLPGDGDILVGVMGSSHVCSSSFEPDVHTQVAPYINWIASIIGV